MDLDLLYSSFNEDVRLHSKASSIEFLTTTYYIDKHINTGMKILDIGAGTGAYSLHYARKGYEVTSIDLVHRHIDRLKEKITPELNIQALQGNALNLSSFADESFDIVLCLGPLYHLNNDTDKLKCIFEAKRVCKKNGVIFFAYISNDMVIVTESILYNPEFFKSNSYDHETFKVVDHPFCFITVEKMISLMKSTNLNELNHFAADGLSELLAKEINQMTDEKFNDWFRFHLYTCEKKSLLGYSSHIVFVAQKLF